MMYIEDSVMYPDVIDHRYRVHGSVHVCLLLSTITAVPVSNRYLIG